MKDSPMREKKNLKERKVLRAEENITFGNNNIYEYERTHQ